MDALGRTLPPADATGNPRPRKAKPASWSRPRAPAEEDSASPGIWGAVGGAMSV